MMRTMTLCDAAANGDVSAVRHMLAAGSNVDEADRHGMTALFYAVRFVGVVEVLLAAGAAVDHEDSSGETALHEAARQGSAAAAQLLLAAGAAVDYENNDGETALHMAARSGSVAVAQLLLAAGANASHLTLDDDTALMYAAQAADAAMVQLLLEAGADVSPRNVDGSSALMYAAGRCGSPRGVQVLRQLLAAGAADLVNAFLCALCGRRTEAIRVLLPLLPADAALAVLLDARCGCDQYALSWLPALLGKALARDTGLAGRVVRHMPEGDTARLRTALLALNRPHVYCPFPVERPAERHSVTLPLSLVHHILHFAFAV